MSQEDQNKLDFPFDAFEVDGKLILKHQTSGKIIELDFEEKNKNLTKNGKKNIKNKIKSDAIMSEEEEKKEPKTEDLTEDAKTEIRDGQKVKTEAEGDDDEVEEKIKGDPYQDGDKEKGEKFEKNKKDKKDMMYEKIIEDLSKRLDQLETDAKTNEGLLSKVAKGQEAKDITDLNNLKELLQVKPYEVPLETMKDMNLEDLAKQKLFLDNLPHVKDFYESDEFDEHLTHEDVNKYAFDMNETKDDFRADILGTAQGKFASDFGDAHKQGGAKEE